MIADETVGTWVDEGHFDGSYSYAVLQPDEAAPDAWARGLSPGACCMPAVNPGFSAVPIGYEDSIYLLRRGRAAYGKRRQAVLGEQNVRLFEVPATGVVGVDR